MFTKKICLAQTITAALVVVFMCTINVQLHAQDQQEDEDLFDMSIEDLMNVEVVSAGRHIQKITTVPATVHTITRRDIELSGATNLAEILRDVVGVSIARKPGDFPEYTAVIRGFFSDFMNERILVMIDGVPLYHPHGGGPDLGWISLSSVKRVEVVKGPVSALYGANAFGGIVNVITQSGTDGDFFGEAGVGTKIRENLDNDETKFATYPWVSVGGNEKKFDYFLSMDGFFNKSGYMERFQGEENFDFFAKAGYQASEQTRYQISSLVSRDEWRVGVSDSPDPMENYMTNFSGIMETRITDSYTFMLRGYLNNIDVKYSSNTTTTTNDGDVLGAEIQNTFRIGDKNILIIGGDIRHDKVTNETVDITSGVMLAGYGDESTDAIGIYAQEEYLGIDRLYPVIGVRYDHNSEFGSAVSPRIGLSYELDKDISSYVAVGKAFRAPNFNELYISDWGKVGNPDLDPEQSTNYEIGCKGVLPNKRTRFDVSVFRHEIEDMIVTVLLDSGLSMFENSGDNATIMGVEAEVLHKFPLGISPFFNISLLDTDDGSGQSLKKVPETKLIAGIDYQRNSFDARFRVRHKSDNFYLNSNPAIASDANGHVTVDQITTMDLFASKIFALDDSFLKHIRVSAYIENITDKQYKEAFAPWIEQDTLRMPGRTFGIEVSAVF